MLKNSYILVTGGAGYIGSHIVKQLNAAGEKAIVLDNLSTGYADSVPAEQLIIGDSGDYTLVNRIMHDYKIEAVIHLAASLIVPESIQLPLKYYENNVANSIHLYNCCIQNNIKHIIFSSSASVYGISSKAAVTETDICNPINPYGRSKLMSEWILQDICNAHAINYVALRYFNVGGADPNGQLGLYNPNATTLIKVAAQAALGVKDSLTIYGTDYPTFDGTGIRDYIHVEDIASAHLNALAYLRQNNPSTTLNCGYGHGYSVRQIIETVQRLANKKLTIKECPRRPGDPAEIIANASKIREVLAWEPRFDNLDIIIQTSLAWEKKLLAKSV